MGNAFYSGKVIRLPMKNFQDTRGILTPLTFADYNFYPVRAFVINATTGSVRGGHAHARGRQLLMLISGEVEIETRYQNCTEQIRLDPQHRAVLIEAPVWAQQTYRGSNPAIVVFCDTVYDPCDYISQPC